MPTVRSAGIACAVALGVYAFEQESFNFVRGVERQPFLLAQIARKLLQHASHVADVW